MRLLEGKSAVVTGSNRGIGKAIVKVFAENGANIWACARKRNEDFETFLDKTAAANNIWIKPIYFDLNDEKSIENAIKEIVAEKRDLDIAVLNAGIAHNGMLIMTPIEKIREIMEINFFAQMKVIQMLSREMIRKKCGTIITIGSIGGINAQKGYIAYGASKAALMWATRALSAELSPLGIRVNSVAPGLTDTEQLDVRSSKSIDEIMGKTSLARKANPIEIADVALFLASDLSSYITGQIIKADGGRGY